MAHFAQLDSNNTVIAVVVVNNNAIGNLPFPESEPAGIEFLRSLEIFSDANFKQTSYNKNFRKNYANGGYLYDEIRDAFIPPKPYDSWTLNEDTCRWEAPVPYPNNPDDEAEYIWDEEILNWKVDTPSEEEISDNNE